MEIFNKSETKEKRKLLRRNQTEAEKLMWSKLRNKQLNGYKFFRQFGIDQYIADFYCPKLKLVIELDGGQHYKKDAKEYDSQREKYMLAGEIKTIRFSNIDVLENIEKVYLKLKKELLKADL
ncbi:MAG: endonuclease domain-containing protein [Elusimicrobiota bacterium]